MQIQHPEELQNMPEFLFGFILCYILDHTVLNDPREETFYETIKMYCCPSFMFHSFTFYITLAQIVVFFNMVIFGEFNNESQEIMQFTEMTLDQFGRCQAYSIKYKLEFYRIFTTLLIFNNIKELCGGILFQLLIGSLAEKFCNKSKMFLLYFASGFGGVFTYIVFYDQSPTGNMFSIFGFMGAIFGFVIQSTQEGNEARQMMVQVVIFILVIGLIGLFYRQSLIFGYFGSFIVGIILGLILPVYDRILQKTKLKFVGLGIIFIYFTSLVYIFYTYRKPTMPIIDDIQ